MNLPSPPSAQPHQCYPALRAQLRDPSVMSSNTTGNSIGRGELKNYYLAGAGWLGFKVQCWRLHLVRTQCPHRDTVILLHPKADWIWWSAQALHRMKHRRLWSKPLLFQIPCIIQSKTFFVVSRLKMDWHISLLIRFWHELADIPNAAQQGNIPQRGGIQLSKAAGE